MSWSWRSLLRWRARRSPGLRPSTAGNKANKALNRSKKALKLAKNPSAEAQGPKGYDVLERIKVQAAERWVSAVNADGRYGQWRYAITRELNAVPALLDELDSTAGVAG